ncbi:MAG TPA: hypothetical protein VGM01_06070 [Ktedonobacteraceae bacterium]|jgi:hypothetical protein
MDNQMLAAFETMDNDAARKQGNFWQRLGVSWLRFSGPDQRRFNQSLEDQERLRRSRILSGLLFLMLISVAIVIPTAIVAPTYWTAILIFVVLGFVAFFCNRATLINLGGLFVIFAIDATVITIVMALPKGIGNSNIPDFDFFIIATLVGGIVLPRRILPFLALFHIMLIFTLFSLLPHDPLLTKEIQINQGGSAYNELSDTLLLQVIGAAIAWLNARSVDLALLRASKAEELAATQRSLSEQTKLQGEQMERLEYGIEVLKEAHARFANGDYRARAVLQANELAPLAISFNLLADRLNRIARDAQAWENLELAFQQLFAIQERVIYGGQLRPLLPTGTLVDKIYPWLKQYFLFRQVYNRCGVILEKARFALTRQRAVLAQLKSALDQVRLELRLTSTDTRKLSPAFELIEKAQNLCNQIEEQGKLSLQETRQLDQMLKV